MSNKYKITKPTISLIEWASQEPLTGGNIDEPSNSRKNNGWQDNEALSAGFMNHNNRSTSDWLNWATGSVDVITDDLLVLSESVSSSVNTISHLQYKRAGRNWTGSVVGVPTGIFKTTFDSSSDIEYVWDNYTGQMLLFGADDDRIWASREGETWLPIAKSSHLPFSSSAVSAVATDGAGTFVIESNQSAWFNDTPGNYRAWTEITNLGTVRFVAYHSGSWLTSDSFDNRLTFTTLSSSVVSSSVTFTGSYDASISGDYWASNGTRWVVVADSQTEILWSEDMATFHTASSPPQNSNGGALDFCWWPAQNLFVYAPDNEFGIYTSPDGDVWTQQSGSFPYWLEAGSIQRVATDGKALYIANQDVETILYRTEDLVNWEAVWMDSRLDQSGQPSLKSTYDAWPDWAFINYYDTVEDQVFVLHSEATGEKDS